MKNRIRKNWIIGIIGVLSLIIACFVKALQQPKGQSLNVREWLLPFLYDAILNIAFVIVGVILVELVWNLVGGNPDKEANDEFRDNILHANTLLADSVSTGITRVFTSSSDMGSSKKWVEIIKRSTDIVYFQGYTLLVLTRSDNLSSILIGLASRGAQIRFLLMDEEAKYIDAGVNEDIPGLSTKVVKSEIIAMSEYLDKLIAQLNEQNPNCKGSIEYKKVVSRLITSQIIITDDKACVTPYLTFFNTSHCPLFIIENSSSGLYKKYRSEFEQMWKSEVKKTS